MHAECPEPAELLGPFRESSARFGGCPGRLRRAYSDRSAGGAEQSGLCAAGCPREASAHPPRSAPGIGQEAPARASRAEEAAEAPEDEVPTGEDGGAPEAAARPAVEPRPPHRARERRAPPPAAPPRRASAVMRA